MQRNDIYRIIDANINRVSEALRVLEDYARYAKDNKELSEKLKSLRHKINSHFSHLTNLIQSRDSNFDVGRDIENPRERKTTRDIICANCKRFEEALRVLSEYGQLVDIKVPENFRYEVYTIEKELSKNEKLFRLQNASLYLVTNRDNLNSDKDFLAVIEKSIEGGIDIIQLREKKESERKILELAKEIKKLTANTEVLFIINDRVDLALSCDADGVHLGQDDMPVSVARKITPDGFIIGLSTHSPEQGLKGLQSGADYLGVGPVFPTPTKPDYKTCGLEYVRWASENLRSVPFFVIGGIDETNIDKVISSSAEKIAVVRAIINASNPKQMTQKLKETLLLKKKVHAKVR